MDERNSFESDAEREPFVSGANEKNAHIPQQREGHYSPPPNNSGLFRHLPGGWDERLVTAKTAVAALLADCGPSYTRGGGKKGVISGQKKILLSELFVSAKRLSQRLPALQFIRNKPASRLRQM